jgi:hypothetical protein
MSKRGLVLVLVIAACIGAPLPGRGAPRQRTTHRSLTSGLDCSTCHTPEGWHLMDGKATGRGFDHSRTGFPLTGRHRETPCAGCHQAGMRSLSRTCVSCHDDAHRGRLGQACDRCHSAANWARTDVFARHRLTRLPLSGMHALADCSECHRETSDRLMRNVPADCFACHAKEYRSADTHPPHAGVAGDPTKPPLPTDCSQCHRATAWSPAFIATGTFTGAARSALVAPLVHEALFRIRSGKHRGAECETCHVDTRSPRLVRCDGCHAHSISELALDHRAPVSPSATGCLTCHPGGARR